MRAGKGALWTLAVVVTLASAVWQRVSGPTYPVRGAAAVGGTAVSYRLLRSHGGPGDQPVRVTAPDPAVSGTLAWRRYPSSEAWRFVPMTREGDALVGALPHQPPAGKLAYQVRLSRGADTALFPERPAVTRFKGDVPAAVLIPHVLAMFTAMLLSTAAGLFALAGRESRGLALATLVLLAAGGLVLGPVVQKLAFGAYWTGIPFGYDLTDNKTLVAAVAWAAAALAQRGGRPGRGAVILAACLTLAVFAVPHSVWGSQIRWDATPAAVPSR